MVKSNSKRQWQSLFVAFIALVIGTKFGLIGLQDACAELPKLNHNISPLHPDNREILKKRFLEAFDKKYQQYMSTKEGKAVSDNFEFYYFRQELQALVDMYHATNNSKYLNQAKQRSLEAIKSAIDNTSELVIYGNSRGFWPCFNRSKVRSEPDERGTIWHGHGQLNDFQGSAGLMILAHTLKEQNDNTYKEIADFVEKNIVEKWLFFRNPNLEITETAVLHILDGARDKREHFAFICLQLDKLGYNKYPYRKWGELLISTYVGTIRQSTNLADGVEKPDWWNFDREPPVDWGVVQQNDGSFLWYWRRPLIVQDTSHANRTVWLAVEAYETKLINRQHIDGFIRTFKNNVWFPQKGLFFFNNTINGTNPSTEPGRRGNIWFGWHRLAAYDDQLKDLFISLAYDLTNGGPNITPKNAQNKTMTESPLCLYAWATRLLTEN